MHEKKRFSPPAVGAASLLVIFAVLCLTVFALLSLSTVKANRRLSDSACAAVESYYTADTRAEEILARLRAGELPEGVQQNGDIYSYDCPISDSQTLAVQLRIQNGNYEILRWQAVSTADWQANDSLPVWDGSAQ